MRRSKRYSQAQEGLKPNLIYKVDQALNMLKERATAGFDETAEVSFNLSIKPAQVVVRGTCKLPHGTGKTVRVLAFAKGEKYTEAEEAGADYIGGEDLAEKIQNGWFEFDKVVATPDMMGIVGKLGRLLGPRGLMPSPKTGTVTKDIGVAISDLRGGMVEFRSDRYGIIHTIFGRASFTPQALRDNLLDIVKVILERRPTEGVKGKYIKKATISSTMGPGISVDIDELVNIAEENV
ncbi:50S ribosomal protein L1 [Candidatus Acetothermia bacterium]|nr:50S ribosomal protein L1 [Candidatus Acetothermia bacterium]